MRLGLYRCVIDLADSPCDANGRHLPMQREPAVEVAATVTQPKPRRCESDARHEHHVRQRRGAIAGRNAAFINCRRRLSIPSPVVHAMRGRLRKRQCDWQL